VKSFLKHGIATSGKPKTFATPALLRVTVSELSDQP